VQLLGTTGDGPQTVLAYYDKKFGTALASGDAVMSFVASSERVGGKLRSTITLDDSSVPDRQPLPPGAPREIARVVAQGIPRGVLLRQLTRDEARFFVSVLVTRTKDDARTHVLVTYLKK
jgi:hypothetical protein